MELAEPELEEFFEKEYCLPFRRSSTGLKLWKRKLGLKSSSHLPQ